MLNEVEMLKKYFYISILLGVFALSGCTNDKDDKKEMVAESSPTEQSIAADNYASTTNKDNDEESTGIFDPILIEAEIASPDGASRLYFSYTDSIPVKISLSNTGTESFIYKIQNVNKDTHITDGILKSNESFEQIYDELPEGDYIISFVVQEEEDPINIKLKVKVELLP